MTYKDLLLKQLDTYSCEKRDLRKYKIFIQ